MDKIALFYGGNSPENEISILTALKVYEEMKKNGNEPLLVYIDFDNRFYSGKSLDDVKNYQNKKGFKKIKIIRKNDRNYISFINKKKSFDYAYILGHGINIEDGTLSSFFEMMNIPYLYDDLYNVSLLQDKSLSKKVFEKMGINTINGVTIFRHEFNQFKSKNIRLNYPLIVKPSRLGSSIGVEMVSREKDLKKAVFEAFKYDETVIIEECISSKVEYNIALVGYQNKLFVSSLEKVNDENRILDFFSKYDYSKNNTKRIINPQMDIEIEKEIESTAKYLFEKLNLCGIYRFDFIHDLDENKVYLNEVNVLPGSLAYYLFESKDLKFIDLILIDINLKKKKYLERNKRQREYEPNFIKDFDISKVIK